MTVLVRGFAVKRMTAVTFVSGNMLVGSLPPEGELALDDEELELDELPVPT